jgi:hypothetical protein
VYGEDLRYCKNETGDWKVARTRRLESLRYVATALALHKSDKLFTTVLHMAQLTKAK